MSSTSSSTPSPSATGTNTGGNPSSPLLFFVALGFGVVFTNLWIIVGVKYCFRYNQRNRALRAHADGDPIDLTAMPRPHRRRREKKLMSVEEVNARFPLIKYKAWRASREKEGLPTAGGISTSPPSRATSVKSVQGLSGYRASADQERPGSSLSQLIRATPTSADAAHPQPIPENEVTMSEKTVVETNDLHPSTEPGSPTVMSAKQRAVEEEEDDDDEEDEEDPIRDATAPEMLSPPGDTCAICLDTLEDDEDVRGLTCGHAFHAACVDPWLTARRACCPLCKADYHVPKPRLDGENDANASRRTNGMRLNLPQAPQSTWLGGRYLPRSRMVVLTTNRGMGDGADGRSRSVNQNTSAGDTWRPRMPQLPRNPFRRRAPESANPTPAQLEAGAR